jgi:acyl-CoA reductase LuxC
VTPVEPAGDVRARLDAAARARERLRSRPLDATIDSLAGAARRWRADPSLAPALAVAGGLSVENAAAAVDIAAEAVDADAMRALVEREWGPGACRRPAPAGPALVAHVMASNVPALALPAIVHACLVGAAVIVKSGRHDAVSAPAFVRALAAVDPDLAGTVVAAYWPGGDTAHEDLLQGANVVIATGGDMALAALARRIGIRLVAYGPRASAAVVSATESADALALDVALHDQRGCLSPHDVFVVGDAPALARRLASALDALAERLPAGDATVEERAGVRAFIAGAEWSEGTRVLAGPGGAVVLEPLRPFRPTPGRRTVTVHPLPAVDDVAPFLPVGGVECVGVDGVDASHLAGALAARGVSRICPVGRMQRPRLSWPRGQRPPLGVLLGRTAELAIEVET